LRKRNGKRKLMLFMDNLSVHSAANTPKPQNPITPIVMR